MIDTKQTTNGKAPTASQGPGADSLKAGVPAGSRMTYSRVIGAADTLRDLLPGGRHRDDGVHTQLTGRVHRGFIWDSP